MSEQDLEKEKAPEGLSKPDAAPNGGLSAWIKVLGAFMLFFNTWGIVNSFGAYQAFYETNILSSHIIPHRYHGLDIGNRILADISGSGTVCWLGCGCIFLPSVAIVATYFTTKRALTTCITAGGDSIGSVIYPIIFRRLQPELGFGWATRVIGFVALAILLVSIVVLRPRLPPDKGRAIFDVNSFRSLHFMLFSIGGSVLFIGLYLPIFYSIVYAQKHASVDTDMTFYLLAIFNGAFFFFGRVIPGLLADRLGSLESMIICTIVLSVFAYAWMAIQTLAGLVVFAISYGFFSGAAVSLPSSVVVRLAPGIRLMGTWMCISFCFFGIGILIGRPITGTIMIFNTDDFTDGFIFAGSLTVAAVVISILAK